MLEKYLAPQSCSYGNWGLQKY